MNPESEQLLKSCNEFIWCHQYPPPHYLELGSIQHRDLVRTFFAGYFEALITVNARERVEALIPLYEEICGTDWLPNSRFGPPLS